MLLLSRQPSIFFPPFFSSFSLLVFWSLEFASLKHCGPTPPPPPMAMNVVALGFPLLGVRSACSSLFKSVPVRVLFESPFLVLLMARIFPLECCGPTSFPVSATLFAAQGIFCFSFSFPPFALCNLSSGNVSDSIHRPPPPLLGGSRFRFFRTSMDI